MAAVSRVVVLLVALGREPCAKNTGAYCRVRARLPEKAIERLAVDVARGCEAHVPQGWLWHQRHVKMIDGTTCSMPDTEENRAAYPQHSAQKEGLGFPLIRIVVALSQEYYRQLFTDSCAPLRQEIEKITGVEVREATAEIEMRNGSVVQVLATGTMVQVFLLAQRVPADT